MLVLSNLWVLPRPPFVLLSTNRLTQVSRSALVDAEGTGGRVRVCDLVSRCSPQHVVLLVLLHSQPPSVVKGCTNRFNFRMSRNSSTLRWRRRLRRGASSFSAFFAGSHGDGCAGCRGSEIEDANRRFDQASSEEDREGLVR